MTKKFATSLSNQQYTLARTFEHAGLTTFSQAVKAFERGETARIDEWKRQLKEKQEKNGES